MTPEQEAEAVFAVLRGIPDIGDTFTVAGIMAPEHYVVTSYFKRWVRPPVAEHLRDLVEEMDRKYPPAGHGPDNVPLVFCRREEAEYVGGRGVAGRIMRIEDVHVDGRVGWSEEHLAEERQMVELAAGERLF